MGMHSRKVGGTMPTRQTVYICGNWPGDNMSGLQRYADSIIHQLDRIVGIRKSEGREHLDIVLVSPADCSSYPAYRNISIDKVGVKGTQGTFPFKLFSRLWKYIVFPLHRAVHPGIGVDLAQALPEIYGASGHYIDPARNDYRIDDLLAEHTWAKAGEQMYALLEKLASA